MRDSVLYMVELPDCVTAEYYDSVDMYTVESIWQLCYSDLSDHKIEISTEEELSELCFNTETVFPKNLQGLADKVLQEGKSHRLNTCGLTGKGVKVAVIDRAIRQDHVEFDGRLNYIEVHPDHPERKHTDFHGMVCAGFDSVTEYVHWCKAASESWTMPHVAGAYACALQVNPDLQYADFIKMCKECPRKDGFIILDMKTVLDRIGGVV